jgi:hypothetical protein
MSFCTGDLVEVYDVLRDVWLTARVEVAHYGPVEADLFSLPSPDSYDVSGSDDSGPFHGRWDTDFVRRLR